MGEIRAGARDALTETIAARHREMWDAYMRVDEPAHSACMTEDFRAVHPDGTVHVGRPSAKEIAATQIDDYWLTEMHAWPLGADAAMATYTAEVRVSSGDAPAGLYQFEVGEVWLVKEGNWKCRYYQATPRKSGAGQHL